MSTLDVADAEETRQLLQLANQMAPVGGIFHLAMVMADKWIANQVLYLQAFVLSVNHLASFCLSCLSAQVIIQVDAVFQRH